MLLHGQDIDRDKLERLTGNAGAAGGVRSVVLDDGPERGVRALEFKTGTGLAFEVLVDRAMDIGIAEHQGRAFGWRAAAGFRNPSLHENADEGGLAWLRSFSGLLATGGLDHTLGPAEVDASQFKLASRKTIHHPLHGRIAYTPAKLQGYGELWKGDGCTLWAEGEVRQAALFGENLQLQRRIESDLGSDEIRICDTVRNCGFDATPHMFLYHINFGWPLLDRGTRILVPAAETRLFTQIGAEQRLAHDVVGEPAPGRSEQVFEHELVADSKGRFSVLLVNDRLKFGIEVEWLAKEFPCFVQWLFLREGAYVVGIEPSTHHVEGNQAARDDGSMIWLNHGESRSYHATIRVLTGEVALEAAAKRIGDLIR